MLGHKQLPSKSMLGHKLPLGKMMLGHKKEKESVDMNFDRSMPMDEPKKSALEKRIPRAGNRLGLINA